MTTLTEYRVISYCYLLVPACVGEVLAVTYRTNHGVPRVSRVMSREACCDSPTTLM